MSEIPKHIKDLSKKERALLAQRLIEEKRKAPGAQTSPLKIKHLKRDTDTFLVSFSQQRLWFIDQLVPGNTAYNIPLAIHLEGLLDIDALTKSINEIIKRHEILRTTFKAVHGEPMQVIHPVVAVEIPIINMEDIPETEQKFKLTEFCKAEGLKAFDLSAGPLIQMKLLRFNKEEHVFLVTVHHILFDERSVQVFMQELILFYEAFSAGTTPSLPDITIQYVDFVHWERERLKGELLAKELSYWKERLSNLPVLELPTDHPRPTFPTFQGKSYGFKISKETTSSLQTLSNREGTTLFMTLLAAFQILLYRYTGQEDIAVGVPFANRNTVEIENLIGFFINTLVMRTDMSERPAFLDLLRRVRDVALGAYSHQELPFGKLVDELQPERNLGQNPFYQVTFQLLKVEEERIKLSKLNLNMMGFETERVRFDLELHMLEEKDGIVAFFTYNTDIFEASTIIRMAGHLECLLESIVKDPNMPITDLEMLRESEKQQLLVGWNSTRTDYPRDISVPQLFEVQVERTPDNVAVLFENQWLTYRKLNQRANQLAHHLQKLGVGPEVLVGICVERSLEMIVGLLAILKAGGAYVPLDPSYPQERLAFMLEDSRIPVLLSQKGMLEGLPTYKGKLVHLDSDWDKIKMEAEDNPVCYVNGDNLAYVMYTSGSTGMPKGISVTHRGINRLVINTNYVDIKPCDRIAQASIASFDAATFEIWGALLNGASLVGISKDVLLSPQAFVKAIRDQRISVLFLTTALFNQIAQETPQAFKSLRYLLFGGEAVTPRWVRKTIQNGPPEHLLHVYGPTENTTYTSWYPVKDVAENAATIPIGVPISNTQFYVLDRYLQPVPVGIAGELFIGGDGLARDYLNRPDLTAEKYIPNPYGEKGSRFYRTGDLVRYIADGNIEFIGRVDHQIKLRGFRIELGEIEAILKHHPAVQDVVVVVREDHPGEKRLVAYVVSKVDGIIPQLTRYLQDKLPAYMLPNAFVVLDSFPLNPNGKVDRNALPAPKSVRPELEVSFTPPGNSVEAKLVEIWENVLGVKHIGIHDSFFELGGNSLLLTRLVSAINSVFPSKLQLRTLFEEPTVAGIAKSMDTVTSQSTPDLSSEAVLDPAIIYDPGLYKHVEEPTHIFLTGATGFLGAFLLYDLLLRTQAQIYCLVRASTSEECKIRIKKILESYSLWDENLSSRITPVPGDLSRQYLGMTPQQFNEMADKIDTIYHNGALVNFMYPYAHLKAANVSGTQEVLRLAGEKKIKPMHYVSTLGVFSEKASTTDKVIGEQDELSSSEGLIGGYSQSKWVAERLVTTAGSKGLPVAIYRPGRITGHSLTGAFNTNDMLCKIIKGGIEIKGVPDLDIMIDMTPVDYVSSAIVYLSKHKKSLGRNFHLFNLMSISWGNLFKWINDYGYPIQHIPYEEWRQGMLKITSGFEDHALALLLPEHKDGGKVYFQNRFGCENTQEGLRASSITCPPVDDRLLETYFSYFVKSGFLKAPEKK